MDKVENLKPMAQAMEQAKERSPGLRHITHKEFNEFIKGKGFKGRNKYKLKELKVMFGFKPMDIGFSVTIYQSGGGSSEEPVTFSSISKVSTSTGIPYSTLLCAKKNSRSVVHSNGKEYMINFNTI